MPFCTNCGEGVELSSRACPKCGQPPFFSESMSDPDELRKAEQQEQKDYKPDSIPVAEPSRRLVAGLIDIAIGIGLMIFAYSFLFKRIAVTGTKIRWLVLKAFLPFLPAAYFLIRDSFGGKSFGKLFLGLTTINTKKRKAADLTDSLLRNSFLAIIAIPLLGWIAFAVMATLIAVQIFMGRSGRLGDDFANTHVVNDRHLELL